MPRLFANKVITMTDAFRSDGDGKSEGESDAMNSRQDTAGTSILKRTIERKGSHNERAEPSRHGTEYCSFKNDRARLLALISRDVRLVLIVAIVSGFAGAGALGSVGNWLRHFA